MIKYIFENFLHFFQLTYLIVKKNIHEQCFAAKDYLILQNFEDQVDLKWEKLNNIDDELIEYDVWNLIIFDAISFIE